MCYNVSSQSQRSRVIQSHVFKDQAELLRFVVKEIRGYTGNYNLTKVMFKYNRLTIEEIAQEVIIRLLRTVGPVNKKYVRQAVVFTCIDCYRKTTEYCPSDEEKEPELKSPEDPMPERLMQLHKFSEKELQVVMMLLEGRRNPEIREILDIPKVSYYTLLNRIKNKYSNDSEPMELEDLELS